MNNINAFALTPDEKTLFAGTLLGELWIIDVETFSIKAKVPACFGAVNVVAVHPTQPYVALHGEDHWLVIFKYDKTTAEVELIHRIRSRAIQPNDDPYIYVPSTSQCLCFHYTKLRLASHGGTSALFELEFTNSDYQVLHCTRLHGAYDLITACYHADTDLLLSASSRGEIVLSKDGEIIKCWEQHDTDNQKTVHWLEPYKEEQYLCASDAGKIIVLDINNDCKLGPWFARDHLEHVTQNRVTKKIYAASFDRNVYEISETDFSVNHITWKAPFKLRWIKSLSKSPHNLIVQCRNGGLYKVSVNGTYASILSSIKETPDALWSGVFCRDSMIIAGEGNYYYKFKVTGRNRYTQQLEFQSTRHKLPCDKTSYTKRVALSPSKEIIAFGRVDGYVIVLADNIATTVHRFDSPIRDIVFGNDDTTVYVATESGFVYDLNIKDKGVSRVYQSKSPIWALAYNPELKLLALAHRYNEIYFIDTEVNKIVNNKYANLEKFEGQGSKFIKRMRWADKYTLFIGYGGGVSKYNYISNTASDFLSELLPNTVEDFAWDNLKNYFLAVNYSRQIFLCDYDTGKIIKEFDDYSDYTKGILMLDSWGHHNPYCSDLITFGRYEKPRYLRINNDRIITLGDIN